MIGARIARTVVLGLAATSACARGGEGTRPPEKSSPTALPAIEIHDNLEARIMAGTAGKTEREQAYERVKALPDEGTAAHAFARAAIAGRLAEERGLGAGKLVSEAERWAEKSIERDPEFRDRAATRMLGTLYVLAPARLLEHGDSETGLEILEKLATERPQDPRNRLRVAEAYVALGDPDPAFPHLCFARAHATELPRDEQGLLQRLIDDVGGADALSCHESGT